MVLTKVVLLVVGSFNPPTIMHLRMLELARDYLDRTGQYKVIGGIMSPVHDKYGKKDLACASDRHQMLRLALGTSNWIKISEWESTQDQWTRTKVVLQHHQNTLNAALRGHETPNKRQRCEREGDTWMAHALEHCNRDERVLVKLLCGADVLQSFGVPGLWKDEDIETIIEEHGLIVITRDCINPLKIIYESDLLTKHMRNITIVPEWITNEISSTKIRRALRRGESVKYLLPDPVIEYIKKNTLYMANDNKYELFPPDQGSVFLTPSPNDDPMSPARAIDAPDSPRYYVADRNYENSKRSVVRPGTVVKVTDQGGKGKVRFEDDCSPVDELESLDDLTKVEIQIDEDGVIQVISDKETTV